MSAIAVQLRNRGDVYSGFLLMGLGSVIVLMAIVIPFGSAIVPALVGIAVSLLGLLAVGQKSNRLVLQIHPDRIEWDKGFGWRWFAPDPVQYTTVTAVVVSPQRRSIILAREGRRPPFVFLKLIASDFPRAVEVFRERLPHASWVTSDLPLFEIVSLRGSV